ncbi:TMEM175 family protein [Mucilaginibacter agri]|uniref:DUF1211 domain-containing protein n=1 Tax=Mucilaginibacter agri TaxID=2695265 RepID=A0A965ZF85_9SPHI|nr:DUF1211 domain-containing protein [Mucilaginibacter agri]
MNTSDELDLKKEFQLERIILFSDAVFAIIITIMVIELHLPDAIRNKSPQEFLLEFKKVYIQLLGYGLSFFFVALFWTKHVKLFRFLKDYNATLLALNLCFLFLSPCFLLR